MDNVTLVNSTWNSTITRRQISPGFTTIAVLTCIWIIVAHGCIVFCFIINRSKPWTNYSKQILSLSLNDLFLGFACLLLLVQISISTSYAACTISFYFFFTALCASLYHVFAICVYRALTLIRNPTQTSPTSVRLSALLVVLAWVASFCLCIIPFLFWGSPRIYVSSCQIDFVFGGQGLAIGFLALCYTLPMICTNVVYAVTCCKLLLIWRKIFSIVGPETSTSSSQDTTDIFSHSNKSGVKVQKRTLVTIGLLLFFFNLFTIPLVVIMCGEYSGKKFPRNIRTLLSNVFILNSAISPFVYAIRTRFLLNAMKDLAKDCLSCMFG